MIVTIVNVALGSLFSLAGAIWALFTASPARLAANSVGTVGTNLLRVFAGLCIIVGLYFILAQPPIPLPRPGASGQ